MSKNRKRYSSEFKEKAAKLITEQGIVVEWPEGTSPSVSRRTGREPLSSSGFSYS